MELHENESVSLHLSNLTLLDDIESRVQKIQIYQHPELGKVLVINNEIHNVEKWAPLYHESIVNIPMMFIYRPQTVLILGGGDLFAAEIALSYPSVKKVVVCDYDPEVIRLTSKHYTHAKAVLEDTKISIVYQDARTFLRDCHENFDLIVDDCFNLVDDFPQEDAVFDALYRLLTPNIGVCSSLMYRHVFERHTLGKTINSLLSHHKTVLSMVTVPEYLGVLHLLTMWGKSNYLSQSMTNSKNQWHIKSEKDSRPCGQYFDSKYCNYYLYLPNYIKNIFLEQGWHIEDV